MRPNRFAIAWNPPALATFYRLSIHAATTVDRAVIQFAERGEGHLEWVPPYHRLLAGSFEILVVVDRDTRMLAVMGIYRVRRGVDEKEPK